MLRSNDKVKKLFIAATMQNEGKTTVSLGMMAAFEELCGPVGFIKPVGQRYVQYEGVCVDEDVALIRSIFPSQCPPADMSPITVDRSFTRQYIRQPNRQVLLDTIAASFARVSEGRRSVIIEGTGHAGVGSCFDASNADVASLLGAKAILVTGGGIGRPIDEVMLNRSLFAERGVELLGVILNKVLPEKLDSSRQIVAEGLGRKGIELLGCIPHDPVLTLATMQQVLDEVKGKVINAPESLGNRIATVIVGAMTAYHAVQYIGRHCLLITPGDRDDLILAAMTVGAIGADDQKSLAGILLTGGARPEPKIMNALAQTKLPVILVGGDSYKAISAVNRLSVKIQPTDQEKIEIARRLVRQYVNVGHIIEQLD